MKKIHLVLAFYFLVYLLLYLFAYNPNLVDGDDASIILYHLCGRDGSIQSPYASYNSGFDFFLGFFENSGSTVRNVAMSVSFVFGLVSLCLCAVFVDTVNRHSKGKYIFLGLVPLIIPDFLFHSLIINSTNVSFSFALAGLILFVRFLRKKNWWMFLVSVLCVGIAIPLRWSMLTIFPLFFALQLGIPELNGWRNFRLTVVHSMLSVLAGFICLWISGYGPDKLIQAILWGQDLMEKTERSMLSMLATGTAFITVPMLVLLLAGIYKKFSVKTDMKNSFALVLIPLVPFVILGFFPAFKFLIALVPMLLIVMAHGFVVIAETRWPKYAFFAAIAGMWFVGLKIQATGTLAGPGFSQTFEGKAINEEVSERNLDTRVKIKGIIPALAGGFYMPMLEGPRPLFGYFYVLFGGGWYDNIQSFADERKTAMKFVTENGSQYLQDRMTALFQCDLAEAGYQTKMKFKQSGELLYREFHTAEDTIRVWAIPDGVSKNDAAREYLKNHQNVVFRSSYSSSILSVTQAIPELQIIGPYSVYKLP